MRVPSGSTDRYIYFVAVDSTDLKTRETGLSSFTAVYSLNGSADTTYTTPTVSEIDATTMPGVYALLLDEGTTLTAGHDTEEYCAHITQASMAPVTRTVEIYRPKGTEGKTITIETDGMAHADAKEWLGVAPLALSSQRVEAKLAATPPTASEIQTEMEENGASFLDTIKDAIEHGTYGLSALQVLIAAISATAIAEAVCDEALSGHETAGTVGRVLNALFGKWEITGNQLKCYSLAGNLLFTYDLSQDGIATEFNPDKREAA